MWFLQLIVISLFSIQIYSSKDFNNSYTDVSNTAYERFKIYENNNTYNWGINSNEKKNFSIKSEIKKIKNKIIIYLIKLSLFYEDKNMIIFLLKNYNGKIDIFYKFVFKKYKINALKILIKYNKYNYNDDFFHYKILLFNNKINWEDKLLDNEYLYTTSFFRFSSLGYLIDKCNFKMLKLAINNGFDRKINSNLLDLSIIKKCKNISLFLSKKGLKADLLLHIMRNDYYGIKFIIKNKVLMNKNINNIKKIETLNENLKQIKVFNDTILDYAIKIGNQKIIKLLKKYGAKRGCEILKTKCKPLSSETEKILKNSKNTKGDK